MGGGEGGRVGQGTASIARTGELGGKVDLTVLIAQETGSGKSERSKERVVANIGTVVKEL